MAVTDEQRNKILTGAGLEEYTKLLKSKFGTIDEEITAVSTTVDSMSENVGDIIEEVWGGSDTTQDSRIDGLEGQVAEITTTIGGLNDAIDGITTTIAGLTTTYKALQDVVAITAPVGSYISEISQTAQGVVGISTTALPTVDTASTTTAGTVQMADGSTTNVVYDSAKVDDLIGALSGNVDEAIAGLTETYKQLQTAYNSGATAALTFVDYIEQNENGDITVTKSTVTLPSNASSTTPGLVTVVGVTNPVANEYEVYNKDKIDELIADIQGGGSGLDGRYKKLQTAVTNPVASGNTITFISGITQDTQGVINPIAMTVPTASTTSVGLVQMSLGSTTSVVYDKGEVDSLIAEQASAAFVAAITATLPAVSDADNNTIYFIANGATTGNNIYDEYLKVNKGSAETPDYAMEKIGSTEFSFDTLSNGDVDTIWTDTPAAD